MTQSSKSHVSENCPPLSTVWKGRLLYGTDIKEGTKKLGGRGTWVLTRLGFCEALRRKGDLGHRNVNSECMCACMCIHRHEIQNGAKDVIRL